MLIQAQESFYNSFLPGETVPLKAALCTGLRGQSEREALRSCVMRRLPRIFQEEHQETCCPVSTVRRRLQLLPPRGFQGTLSSQFFKCCLLPLRGARNVRNPRCSDTKPLLLGEGGALQIRDVKKISFRISRSHKYGS
jgi:hypothetical protein